MWRIFQVVIFSSASCFLHAFDPAQQDDSQALVRHFRVPSKPAGPALSPASFELLPGETISLMGGTTTYQMQEFGFFEARLRAAFPGRGRGKWKVRNLAWPADTVYAQQRPMFYYTEKGDPREGSVPDQREKVDPGTLLLHFGRMESLDGVESISSFESSYDALVRELLALSSRIVLVAPVPFPESGPAAGEAKARNEVLGFYTERIQALAERRGLVFVAPTEWAVDDFTSNGLHLSEQGNQKLAAHLASALGVGEAEASEDLLSAIRSKNRLWHQYYRPTNWAFLFGDRQHVPSSRDHLDSEKRWFVGELERIPGLISQAEDRIHELAGTAGEVAP